LIDGDGDQDEHSDCDLQPERVDTEETAAVVEHADDEGADECAHRSASGAEQAGTADDTGGNGLEFVTRSCGRDAVIEPRRKENPTESCEESGQGVNADEYRFDGNAGQPSRFFVRSHGVHIPTPGCLSEEDGSKDDDN